MVRGFHKTFNLDDYVLSSFLYNQNINNTDINDKQYCISLSSVISPPYTKEKFDKIQEFYTKNCQGMQSNI